MKQETGPEWDEKADMSALSRVMMGADKQLGSV